MDLSSLLPSRFTSGPAVPDHWARSSVSDDEVQEWASAQPSSKEMRAALDERRLSPDLLARMLGALPPGAIDRSLAAYDRFTMAGLQQRNLRVDLARAKGLTPKVATILARETQGLRKMANRMSSPSETVTGFATVLSILDARFGTLTERQRADLLRYARDQWTDAQALRAGLRLRGIEPGEWQGLLRLLIQVDPAQVPDVLESAKALEADFLGELLESQHADVRIAAMSQLSVLRAESETPPAAGRSR